MDFEIINRLFILIWLTDKFSDDDESLINRVLQAGNIGWHQKCVVVSAISLSLLRFFDEKKLLLLADIYSEGKDQVSQRAISGLITGIMLYAGRMSMYYKATERLEILRTLPEFTEHVQIVLVQWLKSKETEKIKRQLEDEILPEVAKFQPKLQEKLDLDKILPGDPNEDKNPEWERVFEDSPDLLDKLQEFSQLQMEGSDVFMSAFSRLKHFSFFNEMINWFIPFYSENDEVMRLFDPEKEHFDFELFLTLLAKSSYMCNSDKYSFCFNLQYMPVSQKTTMMEMFNAEMEGMMELAKEDEILNNSAKSKSIFSQYFHDLYRFYKLHPHKKEFYDIFNIPLDFLESSLFDKMLEGSGVLSNIAEFLFERQFYKDALKVFLILNGKGDNSLEVFEKSGYCYHKLELYEQAVLWYKKAELYDTNRVWNLKKIGLCYRNLKNYEESLKYYLEAEKLEPENLYVKTFIGHNYLDMSDFEKALHHYYQVELLAPDNQKVLRPIGWCLFVLGKFEVSKNYFEKLLEKEPNKYDFMNLGHVSLCLKDIKSALKFYRLSKKSDSGNSAWFRKTMDEDEKYLIKYGITEQDIHYLKEYVSYGEE